MIQKVRAFWQVERRKTVAASDSRERTKMKKGRRGSRLNATSHGIFASILLSGEPWGEREEDYRRLLCGLREDLRPVGCLEEIQVEKAAFLYLRLSRVYKVDLRLAPLLFKKVSDALEKDYPTVETEWVDKEKEVVVVEKDLSPDLLLRYEGNVERQIARTLDRLVQLRQARQSDRISPER